MFIQGNNRVFLLGVCIAGCSTVALVSSLDDFLSPDIARSLLTGTFRDLPTCGFLPSALMHINNRDALLSSSTALPPIAQLDHHLFPP
jgi:hypothetical protein